MTLKLDLKKKPLAWEWLQSAPSVLRLHSLFLSDTHLYSVGFVSGVLRYDPAADTWETMTNSPSARVA